MVRLRHARRGFGRDTHSFYVPILGRSREDTDSDPKKTGIKRLLRWDLGDLLSIAMESGWLPQELTLHPSLDRRDTRDPVPTNRIREIRNLVHPGNYLRCRDGTEISQEELGTLYARCHAAYLCLCEKVATAYPQLPALKTALY
jgi:hypothetical protein